MLALGLLTLAVMYNEPTQRHIIHSSAFSRYKLTCADTMYVEVRRV